MNKHIVWAGALFMITFIICCTVIWINYNSWTVRFEMDDNTKEAIQSIEYPIVDTETERCFQRIVRYDRYIDFDDNLFINGYFYNTTWQETKCGEFDQIKYETKYALTGENDG